MAQLTVEQIVDETVDWYSQDPVGRRSVIMGTNTCLYFSPDNAEKMCAFGRCIDPDNPVAAEIRRKWETNGGSLGRLMETFNLDSLDDILKPQYKGHEIDFWMDLQTLHDNSLYWSKTGLSSFGEIKAGYIKTTYINS